MADKRVESFVYFATPVQPKCECEIEMKSQIYQSASIQVSWPVLQQYLGQHLVKDTWEVRAKIW